MDFSDPKQAFEHITKPATLTPVKENWLMLYQGKPIQLLNGRFRWNKKHHALTALTAMWQAVVYQQRYDGTKSAVKKQWLEDFKAWREKNIVFQRQEAYENPIMPPELDEEEKAWLATQGPEDEW